MFSALAFDEDRIRDKVNLFVAFAPVTNIAKTSNEFMKSMAENVDTIQWWIELLQVKEYFGGDWSMIPRTICAFAREACEATLDLVLKSRNFELKEPYLISDYDRLLVNPVSYKQLIHFGQIINMDRFQLYDYFNEGSGRNKALYGLRGVPAIPISEI
mmetsp:Transcript_10823/g.18126  ORF Transcript_10823/g.18126 Transcript_10823/m.18126 type:complete len:158 (+) Transcript_10823:599-1072(+)|eukprot:CAMPEP_0168618418 /NCGR_PEP_ID=MMETSP0449_2-20121227/6063_1 /TAXON_ID=1082188 /ORGANISM="Strombidium rassoulzadegani, Strain ras09" /LENGTH=157 /DNA_ID=CAMNT_0008659295 /DNA_START=619 /DNA_END=1092 /DNA_ORIENTATION=-